MSEAWRKNVSPSNQHFHQYVNSRLREWQEQEPERSQKQSFMIEDVSLHQSPSKSDYPLFWSEFEKSSTDTEYGTDDETTMERATKGLLRMYQPLSKRDLEVISGLKGNQVKQNTLSLDKSTINTREKSDREKSKLHSFFFKCRSKVDLNCQNKQPITPSASKYGYLRANAIDPGAPCPFPNTPGVTTLPFVSIPVTTKEIDTTKSFQPVSFVVQRHCHEHVHHHHHYHKTKGS